MFLKKLLYKISKILKYLQSRFSLMQVNWGYALLSMICIASIILLGTNIVRITKKGYERYSIIQEEKIQLEDLREKNRNLKEDLKYYSSKEFIDVKAREELNLAFPNQRLVYIERGVLGEDTESPGSSEDQDPIKPSWKLWYNLLFE